MTNESADTAYEPPAIEERTEIDAVLIGAVASSPFTAAFYPADSEADAEPYDPPAIEERTAIDMPLIGTSSLPSAAAFHPASD